MMQSGQKAIISSCCPSINQLIEKYYPDLIEHLAHVLTPMQAHCKAIKEKDPAAYTVFIGPCIARSRRRMRRLRWTPASPSTSSPPG